MELKGDHGITVSPFQPGEESLWADFLARSANGAIYHDPDFLAYHPPDRFRFHHLVFRRRGEVIALLPGALDGEAGSAVLRSTAGASFGGLVLPHRTAAETVVELYAALKDYAAGRSWSALEVTLAQPSVDPATSQSQSFAMMLAGFALQHRWLCHGLDPRIPFETAFRSRQASYVRSSLRNGMEVVERGSEGLDLFWPVFRETFARHGQSATHTQAEITDLMARFPQRIRLHLAVQNGRAYAGLLVFHLTGDVASTFYICRLDDDEGTRADAVVIASTMQTLAARGVRHLDLGPSASDSNFNRGVAFFKEGLGATGSCRDRWRLDL